MKEVTAVFVHLEEQVWNIKKHQPTFSLNWKKKVWYQSRGDGCSVKIHVATQGHLWSQCRLDKQKKKREDRAIKRGTRRNTASEQTCALKIRGLRWRKAMDWPVDVWSEWVSETEMWCLLEGGMRVVKYFQGDCWNGVFKSCQDLNIEEACACVPAHLH